MEIMGIGFVYFIQKVEITGVRIVLYTPYNRLK